MVHTRHPHNQHWHLSLCPTVAPRPVSWCRLNRCQVTVARRQQLASLRRLLQIACRPSVLVSSVQCLTDHPCCAAGNRNNQNYTAEEHLEAKSVTVCVSEMLSTVYIGCRSGLEVICVCHNKVSQHLRWIFITQISWLLLLSQLRTFTVSVIIWIIEPRTRSRHATSMVTACLLIR
jgi:hypothetical protein